MGVDAHGHLEVHHAEPAGDQRRRGSRDQRRQPAGRAAAPARARCSSSRTASPSRCSPRSTSIGARCRPRSTRGLSRLPSVSGSVGRPAAARRAMPTRCSRPRRRSPRTAATSTSRPSTSSSRWPAARARRSSCSLSVGATDAALLEALDKVRGDRRVTSAGSRVDVRGARQVRHRPHRARARRQARPGHRPRRRDPPHRAGAEPPDQEQPRADR